MKEARNSSAILPATLPPIFPHYNGEGNEMGGRKREGSKVRRDGYGEKDEGGARENGLRSDRLSHGKDFLGKSLSQSERITDALEENGGWMREIACIGDGELR